MKGILLAGGNGSRLFPATKGASKHLLPVYDKPLIYYSLTNLMLAGIRKIAVITRPKDVGSFQDLLGDGSQLGVNLTFIRQQEPRGIAEALLLAEDFIAGESVCLALGDNIYHGSGLSVMLRGLAEMQSGATIILRSVNDPERFGVAELDLNGNVANLEEKPSAPKSNLAVTGMYFFDETATSRVRQQRHSARGELEITDLILSYLRTNEVKALELPRGTMWLDTGTIESLMDASQYVRSVQLHTGQLIGSPEEIAWRQNWITNTDLLESTKQLSSAYGESLIRLLHRDYSK